jgi:pseudaminic acid cytidylyltransferase
MSIAIIPARGGSKRIPRKNIRDFCGKPMIAWPIEAAWASGCFDRIVVSTDDEEIAAVARAFGAEVPFMRPAKFAGDFTPTVPVIRHAFERLIEEGETAGKVCCIYPTAPLVQAVDIARGEGMLTAGADYAVSVTTFDYPIQRALMLQGSGMVAFEHPQFSGSRSQDLAERLHDAGQFYWGSREAWLAERRFFDGNTVGVKVQRRFVQDIDTPEDLDVAERLFKCWIEDARS